MKELINNIIEHKNNNNPKICFFLIEYIRNNNILSIQELKEHEDDYYTLLDINGDKKLSDLEVIDKLYNNYDNDYDDFMACSIENQNELNILNEKFKTTDDIDIKYINLIKMYTILDWDMVLPYHTYQYILENRL